jgi:hypothetical protein
MNRLFQFNPRTHFAMHCQDPEYATQQAAGFRSLGYAQVTQDGKSVYVSRVKTTQLKRRPEK